MERHEGERYHISSRRLATFGQDAKEEWYLVKFENRWYGQNVAQILGDIHGLFESILQRARAGGIRDNDLVRIHIRHPDLIKYGDIKMSLRPFYEITPETIINIIEQYVQSNSNLHIDEIFEIALGCIRMPGGGTRLPITSTDGANNSLFLKKSIVVITNTDRLCLARSLVVCRGYKQYKDKIITENEYRYLRKSDKPRQRVQAEDLQKKAGIPLNQLCYIRDIAKFEDVLDAQVIVFSAAHDTNIIYAGKMERDTKYFVYLVENEGMYLK